jgi:hypothetical protein
LPLLAWWALESKAEKEREAVFAFLKSDPPFSKPSSSAITSPKSSPNATLWPVARRT